MVLQVVTEQRYRQLIEQLSEFSKLQTGWNSYTAPSPATAAIENAKSLVTLAKDSNLIPERVEPSAMGGVGATFGEGDREVVVEFFNNGKVHALFADEATAEMKTRAVAANQDDYRKLIDEVRTHLYGNADAAA